MENVLWNIQQLKCIFVIEKLIKETTQESSSACKLINKRKMHFLPFQKPYYYYHLTALEPSTVEFL